MKRIPSAAPVLLALLLLAAPAVGPMPAQAQEIPSPEAFLGHEIGDRFVTTDRVYAYFERLAELHPAVSVDSYGTTMQGREIQQVLIASPEHRARMDEILAANRELMDPSTSEGRARELAAQVPAILYYTSAAHGNEASASEAAMWTVHDLLTGADGLDGVLDSLVVIFDPVANPDGRERYIHFFVSNTQVRDNPSPRIRERREPWPGSRFNHYLFDLNRDWAWLSQQETRDRLVRFHRYNPHVHVDVHEMGYRSSYFFFPAAEPINDIFPDHILEWGERFGEGNAQAFDRERLLYYTAQNFDLFYPGYGDSWPSLVGAVGMTYEQGGSGFAGLLVERPDGTLLSLHDRATGHRVAQNATLRTAAAGRTELVEGFARFHRQIDEGLDDTYLIPGDDPTRAEALVGLLRMHEIEVERLESEVSLSTEPHPGFEARATLPAGTYRVRARQTRGRLAGALLRPDNLLEGTSSYDITAWALPFAYGVEAHGSRATTGGNWIPVEAVERRTGDALPAGGSFGYLLAPSFHHARELVSFLEHEGRVFVQTEAFTLEGRDWPRGTLFFPQGRNDDLDGLLRRSGLASAVTPVRTGRATTGPDLGTNDQAPLRLPRIALLGGPGTSSTGFGGHWFFLEQILDAPFDIVNVSDVSGTDLTHYDVIVIPPGSPSGTLGNGGTTALDNWVRAGGVLIAAGSSAQQLAGPMADIERRIRLDEDEDDRDARLERALMSREERQMESWQERVPGTILKAHLDPAHPLTFGAGIDIAEDRLFVLSTGSVFEPDTGFESVAFFPEGVDRISGVISERNLDRLDRSTWLAERRRGSGRVILFADDPLFRMFWYSGWQLYTNALLMAPSF